MRKRLTIPANRPASEGGVRPRTRGTWGLTVLALSALVAWSAPVDVAADDGVVGSWTVNVSPTIQPHFVGLVTFNKDGGFTETNSLAIGFPPESPGHGQWNKTGPNRFALTFWNLLGDGSGNLAGTAKVRSTMALSADGDQWSGVFQVDIFDADGNFLFSDSGTVEGTRIKVEPLP